VHNDVEMTLVSMGNYRDDTFVFQSMTRRMAGQFERRKVRQLEWRSEFKVTAVGKNDGVDR
jgi:hypothetical protein